MTTRTDRHSLGRFLRAVHRCDELWPRLTSAALVTLRGCVGDDGCGGLPRGSERLKVRRDALSLTRTVFVRPIIQTLAADQRMVSAVLSTVPLNTGYIIELNKIRCTLANTSLVNQLTTDTITYIAACYANANETKPRSVWCSKVNHNQRLARWRLKCGRRRRRCGAVWQVYARTFAPSA